MPLLKKAGRFDAIVVATVGGRWETGNDYIQIMFEVEEGECNGHRISERLTITDKTHERVFDTLKLLGWDPVARGYRFEELGTGDASPIVGAKCSIVVERDDYEKDGKRVERYRVQWINSPGGLREMKPDEAKAFGERLRAKLGVGRGSRVSPEPVHAPKREPDAAFGDVPF